YTFDGGQTWTTVNATPGDPVQRGCIWNGGGSNACRNLLDFNDASVDKQGRVLAAYTDGCANFDFSYKSLTGAVHGPSKCDSDPNAYADTDKANFDALLRQSCGEGLSGRTTRASPQGARRRASSRCSRSTARLASRSTRPSPPRT